MPKSYVITKKQVIKAILTEPLRAGDFSMDFTEFHFDRLNRGRDQGTCPVCAVGAVLRSFKKGFTWKDCVKATKDLMGVASLEDAYKANNFLSILSCEFENFQYTQGKGCFRKQDERLLRLHALMVTEAFCPPRFTVVL